MTKGISLVALSCLFFSFGDVALAEEDSPHFFGKLVKPKDFFQRIEPIRLYHADDFLDLLERIEKSAKRLFGEKLNLSFFLSNNPVKKLFFPSGVKRIHVKIEVDVVFKDGNK